MREFLLAVCIGSSLVVAGSAAAASPNAAVRLFVNVGVSHTYTRGELRPGATVVCRYQHHSLSVQAPSGKEEGAGAGWPKAGTTDRSLFTLNVNVTADKGFAVSCRLGGYHSAAAVVGSAAPSSAAKVAALFQRLSPDRKWQVIYSRQNGYGRLDLIERRTGRRYRMYRSNDSCCDQITWVAPHTLIFVDDYRVKTLDPDRRRVTRIAGFSNFVLSPDRRWVAGYADTGGHSAESVDVVPLAGGACLAVPKRPDQDVAYPRFSSDSRFVSVAERHFSSKLGYDVGPTRMIRYRLAALRRVPTC